MIALLLLLLLICLYLLDEFEHEHSVILIGCVTSMVVVTIVGMTVFRLTFYHACPMCNRKIGNIGDIVSRQIIAMNFTVCFGLVQPTIFPRAFVKCLFRTRNNAWILLWRRSHSQLRLWSVFVHVISFDAIDPENILLTTLNTNDEQKEEMEYDANSCVSFHQGFSFVPLLIPVVTVMENETGEKRLVSLSPAFQPGMTHQVFTDEKITGVENPHIDIYFNPATCDVRVFLFSTFMFISRCASSPSAMLLQKVAQLSIAFQFIF